MRGRSRAGGKPVKARRRKTVTRKRRNAPKAPRRRDPATADLQEQLDRRTRELNEALEQQTAISDILRVISNSPSDVQPVLDSVAQHAAHICEARFVEIVLVDNKAFRVAASFGEGGRLSRPVPLDRSFADFERLQGLVGGDRSAPLLDRRNDPDHISFADLMNAPAGPGLSHLSTQEPRNLAGRPVPGQPLGNEALQQILDAICHQSSPRLALFRRGIAPLEAWPRTPSSTSHR